jgi:hypothetical protein
MLRSVEGMGGKSGEGMGAMDFHPNDIWPIDFQPNDEVSAWPMWTSHYIADSSNLFMKLKIVHLQCCLKQWVFRYRLFVKQGRSNKPLSCVTVTYTFE